MRLEIASWPNLKWESWLFVGWWLTIQKLHHLVELVPSSFLTTHHSITNRKLLGMLLNSNHWDMRNLREHIIISSDISRDILISHLSCRHCLPPYVLTSMLDYSKPFANLIQTWHTHVFRSGEEPYFKVMLNSQ